MSATTRSPRTGAVAATEPICPRRTSQSWRDGRARNAGLGTMPRSGWTTRCNLLTRRIGWPVYPFPDGRAEGRTPRGKPRGLLYDREMLRYSGERFRVLRRVEEIVDEHGGTMLRMPKGTLIPDGEACLGDVEERQIFSLRAIDSFQLETWLMRMDGRSDECRA